MDMDAALPSAAPGAEPIREAAEAWFARLRAPECGAAERRAFERWRDADPRHAAAWDATERLWAQLGALKDAPEARAYELEALMPVRPRRPRAPARRRWAGIPAALAATLAVLAAGLWLAAPLLRPAPPQVLAATGQPRTLTLADGSTVWLDVGTRMQAQLGRKARDIRLDVGRALFQVAHDAARPFTVTAGDGRVTALGTRFQVQRDPTRVTVTLAEGAVAVRRQPQAGQPARQARLQPGQQLSYALARPEWQVRGVDLEAATGWTTGRLTFRGTPLAEAVDEINRYAARKIRLAEPALAQLRLSGTFNAGDEASIADALPAVLPVRVVEGAAGDIVLYPRNR